MRTYPSLRKKRSRARTLVKAKGKGSSNADDTHDLTSHGFLLS
jgi:hypothetical protein